MRVAVLHFQRNRVDFTGSLDLQFAAGDLEVAGHEVELVQVLTGFHGQEAVDAQARTLAWLTEWQPDVVIARRELTPTFAEAVRTLGIRPLYLLQVAYRVPPTSTAWEAVLDVGRREELVGLVDGTIAPSDVAPPIERSALDLGDLPFAEPDRFHPRTRVLMLDDGEHVEMPRQMLVTAWGCPWGRSVEESSLRGLPLAEDVTKVGCSFCAIGGNHRPLPVADGIGFLAEQVGWFQSRNPDVELVFGDESSFDLVGRLLERCRGEGLAPPKLLIKLRLNGLLRRLDRFERSLETARDYGASVAVYLIGVENFSDPVLDRYNKGIDQAGVVTTVRALQGWEEQFGHSVFSFSRYHSHGFILWDPWTTLDDLRTNLRWLTELKLDRIIGKAAFSRLRMHRWQPLFAQAEADGLVGGERFSALVPPQFGYHADEVPWRFADPAVEAAFALTMAGAEVLRGRGSSPFPAFAAALEEVEAREPTEALPLDELRAWASGFAARFDDRELRIETLGPSRDEALFRDFLHLDGGDAAEWRSADGEQILVLSRAQPRDGGWTRRRDRFVAGSRRRLDATRFLVQDDRFVEYAHAVGDGPFERMEPPIVLPGRLRRGEVHSALGVRMLHCGPVRLRCGDRSADVEGLLLEAGDARQWFVRGVGEVWLGRGDQALRWLVGWRAGDRTLLGPVAGAP